MNRIIKKETILKTKLKSKNRHVQKVNSTNIEVQVKLIYLKKNPTRIMSYLINMTEIHFDNFNNIFI